MKFFRFFDCLFFNDIGDPYTHQKNARTRKRKHVCYSRFVNTPQTSQLLVTHSKTFFQAFPPFFFNYIGILTGKSVSLIIFSFAKQVFFSSVFQANMCHLRKCWSLRTRSALTRFPTRPRRSCSGTGFRFSLGVRVYSWPFTCSWHYQGCESIKIFSSAISLPIIYGFLSLMMTIYPWIFEISDQYDDSDTQYRMILRSRNLYYSDGRVRTRSLTFFKIQLPFWDFTARCWYRVAIQNIWFSLKRTLERLNFFTKCIFSLKIFPE